MRSSIAVFISLYHDQLMRFHLNFYRLSRHQNDHKRSKAINIDHFIAKALIVFTQFFR